MKKRLLIEDLGQSQILGQVKMSIVVKKLRGLFTLMRGKLTAQVAKRS